MQQGGVPYPLRRRLNSMPGHISQSLDSTVFRRHFVTNLTQNYYIYTCVGIKKIARACKKYDSKIIYNILTRYCISINTRVCETRGGSND